ncbi:MAG: hypothetical protein DLM61_22630 [Pseudonocardiales bacterium]|nr:MAG: hypothetical protein DLM61_22630 [Pseudonocardiales bacterium]
MQQVWFPGDHCDVGGGHLQTGLSDGAFAVDDRPGENVHRSELPRGDARAGPPQPRRRAAQLLHRRLSAPRPDAPGGPADRQAALARPRCPGRPGWNLGRPIPSVRGVPVMGSVAGWMQERFRQISGNEAAAFFGAPRVHEAPWMALIGVAAATDVDDNGAQQPYQPFVIGQACQQQVPRPGYFYAFANDAWSFYDNNRGSVTLTVTRLD